MTTKADIKKWLLERCPKKGDRYYLAFSHGKTIELIYEYLNHLADKKTTK